MAEGSAAQPRGAMAEGARGATKGSDGRRGKGRDHRDVRKAFDPRGATIGADERSRPSRCDQGSG